MKKFASLLLAVALLIATAAPAFSALAADGCDCGNTPIIYIKGRTMIHKDVDDPDSGLAEKSSDASLTDILKASFRISNAYNFAVLTGNWNAYCNRLYSAIISFYDQYGLNDDGEIGNKSGIDPQWNIENILKRAYEGGKQRHIDEKDNMFMYEFQYDMRLDPLENAKDLRKLVLAVKEITGHKKVSILGRCEGGTIENAYFGLFGWKDVESVIVYNSIACGAELADDCFRGKIVLDSKALNRLAFDYLGSSPEIDLAVSFVDLADRLGLLNLLTSYIQWVYNNVEADIAPRLLRDIFGKCPGWYSIISPDKYEECKKYILGDNADGRYDKLIEKIDNYNYNYKVNARQTLEKMAKDGVHVYVFAKYNFQMYPVIENSDVLGDSTVSVFKQTYNGATCADITKTFDEDYLSKNSGKFISPDKMIDTSNGVLPNHTWYIRNMSHEMYPESINAYFLRLMRSKSYVSVDTYEDFPQWLIYSSKQDVFTPMTESNAPSADAKAPRKNLYKALAEFLQRSLNLKVHMLEKSGEKKD